MYDVGTYNILEVSIHLMEQHVLHKVRKPTFVFTFKTKLKL